MNAGWRERARATLNGRLCGEREGSPSERLMRFAMDEYQQNGVPGDLVKRWVGHSSLKTASEYSHFTKQFRKDIASKLAG
jgi:hypothetical protein